MDKDISGDPRMAPLLENQTVTKVPLRLYKPDYQRTGWDDLYQLRNTDIGEIGLIGIVNTGTEVNFKRAILEKGGGGSWEMLEGNLWYKGERYPIGYNLGLTAYPNGWRRVYQDFEVK
jgi:hypothetical protein